MSSSSSRPAPLPLLPDNVPSELKERRQWVLWRYTWSEEKAAWDKPPLTSSGHRASSTDPATWCIFDEALAAYHAGGFEGIGFVFTPDDEFVGIDLDDCRDSETGKMLCWTPEQRASLPAEFPEPSEIVSGSAGYAEVSPSGTGVKTIVRAKVPRGTRMGPAEIYPHGRYFTITSHRLDEAPAEVRDAQAFIESCTF